jgi:thioredoxin reductase (NADPH)
MSVLAIEKGISGGQLWNTAAVEDYPGFEHISGAELAQKMEEQARKFGLETINETVQHARRTGDYFSIKTDQGEHEALAIVCTAGGSPVKLGVPGEEKYLGHGVSYCAICDGAFLPVRTIL